MNVDLFIYGVPNGEDFWGKEEDRQYFGSFYNQCTDELKFLIQARTLNGKAYCYYNYLIYKNVVAYDGRDGSYFGISLRFEAHYCKKFFNMYRIIDFIYNAYILGNLLSTDKGKLKYIAPDLKKVPNELRSIEKNIMQLIQAAFSKNDFIGLDGFQFNGGKYPNCNLYDYSQESVQEIIMRYGKIAISPYYPSIKEKSIQEQHAAQLESIQHRYENQLQSDRDAHLTEKSNWDNSLASSRNEVKRLNDETHQKEEEIKSLKAKIRQLKADKDVYLAEKNNWNNSLTSSKNEIKRLSNEVLEKDEEIKNLNAKVEQLEENIKNYAKVKDIAELVEPLKAPIMDLAVAIQHIVPDAPKTKATKKNETININLNHTKKKSCIRLISFILVLTIVIAIAVFHLLPDNKKTDVPPITEFDITKVKLDIEPYQGSGYLIIDSEYTVRALSGYSGNENISWDYCFGCQIDSTDDPNIVKMTPKSDSIRIVYRVMGLEQSRILKAKQNEQE